MQSGEGVKGTDTSGWKGRGIWEEGWEDEGEERTSPPPADIAKSPGEECNSFCDSFRIQMIG